MCFHFLYKFCVKHLILRRCQKWTLSSCKVLVTLCQILMTLEYSWQTFKKCSNNKFHKNPSNGSHIAPCGWTDRETQTFIKANSCFLPIPVASLSKVWLCGRSLAGIWVRIPPHEWMSASCELTGRGLCVRLFILREESYRVWVCDREDSTMMRPWPTRTGPATSTPPSIMTSSKSKWNRHATQNGTLKEMEFLSLGDWKYFICTYVPYYIALTF